MLLPYIGITCLIYCNSCYLCWNSDACAFWFMHMPYVQFADPEYISSSLGMCKRCGDLRLIACSRCKGQGIIKQGGLFSFNALDDLSQSFEGNSKKRSLSCKNCQARGHFCCPECSKIPQV